MGNSLTIQTKRILTEEIHNIGMDGNGRFDSLTKAFNRLQTILAKHNVYCQRDSEFIGPHRNGNDSETIPLFYSEDGGETEQELKNCLRFVFTNLNDQFDPKYEILAYIT